MKTFTTHPKTRRHKIKRKLGKIRRTVNELRESFYPTPKIAYNAAVRRLKKDFDLCSPKTILSYLGRLERRTDAEISQTVRYCKTGTTLEKQHRFMRILKPVDGYITLYDAAHLEVGDLELEDSEKDSKEDSKKEEQPKKHNIKEMMNPNYWIICWHHQDQVSLGVDSPIALPTHSSYELSSSETGVSVDGSNKNSFPLYTTIDTPLANRVNGSISSIREIDSSSSSYRGKEKTLERSSESKLIFLDSVAVELLRPFKENPES